ncbi:hypothetical protein BC826DRAFT_1174887 [Russula brevipes]|nr:hypothetical protein BC826DRAFT_1174887 [Russula brevipes]
MDDLWANAWGSPDNIKDETTTTSEKPKDDAFQEDDLSMPSWSTGPGIQWNEPSDTQSSLWSQPTQDWSLANPYSDIPPAPSRLAELPDDKGPAVELVAEPEPHSTPSSPQAQSDVVSAHAPSPSKELDEEVSPSPIPSPAPSPSPSPPPSPDDAFGTFTVGTEHSDITPFTTTIGASFGGKLDDNNWDAPWGSAPKEVDGESAHHASDEWESAKLRQLEMDRRVPPELLSQILLHVEELSNDAWPETQNVVEQDWQKRWHSGMDMAGLDNLLLRYIPTLTLPQLLTSGRSFTAKAMADAVKLSRNSAVACTSPMSTFLAAKGSTAWETSVKSRIETSVDEVPSGWRILEKDPKKDEKVDERLKKPAGLLAGLWSRRASSSPNNPPSPRADHATRLHCAGKYPIQVQSQRSSMESVRSSGTLPTSQPPPTIPFARAISG